LVFLNERPHSICFSRVFRMKLLPRKSRSLFWAHAGSPCPLPLLVLCLLSVAATASGAESKLFPGDLYERIQLISRNPVKTWETEGVRVFLAEGEAEIRQGRVRLHAPRMVVWLDKSQSLRPDVRAAVIRVYAEGGAAAGTKPRSPVRLVQESTVREAGAIFFRCRSKVAFVWNCPVQKLDGAPVSPLLERARAAAAADAAEFISPEIPVGPAVGEKGKVLLPLQATEVYAFTEPDKKGYTVVYVGDVRGAYGNVGIRADTAVVWVTGTGKDYEIEIYARGRVKLSRSGGAESSSGKTRGALEFTRTFAQLAADEVYINPSAERGLATRAELRLADPSTVAEDVYVFSGEEVYMLDSQNLLMRKGSATSCPFARPHFRVTGDRFRVVRDRERTFLAVWDARVRVGEEDTTLVYLPFMGVDLTGKSFLLRRVGLGSSDQFGAYARTTWAPLDLTGRPDWIDDWTVDLDYYGDRGTGIGTNLDYEFATGGASHAGDLEAYYVRDDGDSDVSGLPVPREDRGRQHLRHRTLWNPYWRTDIEYYGLSDAAFLNEFFEDDFETEKPRESYALLRYLKDSTWMGVLFKRQVNDFLTQVEQEPSVEVHWLGVPLGGWVYQGTASVGRYDLELGDGAAGADPPALRRAHTSHRFFRPLTVGFIKVNPFLQALATWASESVAPGGRFSGSSRETVGAGGGVHASADFWRVYDVSGELFDLNRLRHIVTPYIGFETLPVFSEDSERFIQIDRVDSIDEADKLVAGVRQRFQTKRGGPGKWRSFDFLEVDVDYVNESHESPARIADDEYIEADVTWRINEKVTVFSHDNRFSLSDRADVHNLGIRTDMSPRMRLQLDYDHVTDLTSSFRTALYCSLSDRYRLAIFEVYDLDSLGSDESQNLETRVVFQRLFHEWLLELGFSYEKANDDLAFLFAFRPSIGGFRREWKNVSGGL